MIKTENGWYIDENNNRWNDSDFTAEEAAMYSATLKNCKNCTDCCFSENCDSCVSVDFCYACTDCIQCTHCHACISCRNCSSCEACKNCRRCNCLVACTNCDYCSFNYQINDGDDVHHTNGAENSASDVLIWHIPTTDMPAEKEDTENENKN